MQALDPNSPYMLTRGGAIEAGYFPEHNGTAKPDIADFLEAIDEELRGHPRYADHDLAEAAARDQKRFEAEPEPPESDEDRAHRLDQRAGHNLDVIDEAAHRLGLDLRDDEMLIDASDLIDAGLDPDEAVSEAAVASAWRSLDEAARETGNGHYAISAEERFAADDGLPERRDINPDDLAFDGGGGGPEGVAEAAAPARARLDQSQDDPKAAEFGDPAGLSAEAQADGLVHDLEMAASGGLVRAVLDRKDRLSLRLRWLGEQRRALGEVKAMDALHAAELADKEPWLDPDFLLKTYEDDPEGSAAILEAIAEHEAMGEARFRIDEEGGESDLKSILDEIAEAQKAAATMRDCLKPKGGGE
jgi:hypothetical protein